MFFKDFNINNINKQKIRLKKKCRERTGSMGPPTESALVCFGAWTETEKKQIKSEKKPIVLKQPQNIRHFYIPVSFEGYSCTIFCKLSGLSPM